jgi:chromosomal replication initiator protein
MYNTEELGFPSNPPKTNPNSLRSENIPPSWNLIRNGLRELTDPDTFESWIIPVKAIEKDDENLQLIMPNMVFYRAFSARFQNLIENLRDQLQLGTLNISYELGSNPAQLEIADEAPVQDALSNDESSDATVNSHLISKALNFKSNLNPQYTFESFVKGPSNQFAHATCLAVADNPGMTYNPLFIYGSTGLGKTHLLHAVGWRILKNNPDAVICYISSERFMNEMIYCLRFNKMFDFRKKYRNCDVFLVDDIQFISGKDRTQEEFFHTFNALYEAKKQIVITSDKFPQDISDIEDRLRNRFQWGLIADIQPPDVEHRIAILLNKADQLGIRLNHEVAMYIASHAKRNVRELEGALHRIAAYAALHGKTIDLPLAQTTFQNVLGEPPRTTTIETIQKIVSDHFKMKLSDLKSKKRQRAISVPRQIAMFLCREKTSASFPEIGSKFGGKDHTTVMHAVSKIKTELENDLDLKTHIDALERKLEQQC